MMKSIFASIVLMFCNVMLYAQNAQTLPYIPNKPNTSAAKTPTVKDAKELRAKVKKENEPKVVPNEILLSLKNEKVLKDLLTKFSVNRLSVKRKLSSASNYWLVTFDPETISLSSMIDLLRKESGVVGVSSNSIVSSRG